MSPYLFSFFVGGLIPVASFDGEGLAAGAVDDVLELRLPRPPSLVDDGLLPEEQPDHKAVIKSNTQSVKIFRISFSSQLCTFIMKRDWRVEKYPALGQISLEL